MPVSQASPCRPLWALDIAAAGTLLVCGLVFLPGAGRTPLGDLSGLLAVPAWGACLGVLLLRGCARPLFRLKLAALVVAGLAPFASWGVRFSGSLFLVANGTLASFVGVWFLFEVAEMVAAEAERLRNPGLVAAARKGIVYLLYFLLIPLAALHVSFALSCFVGRAAIVEDLRESWHLIPTPMRWLPLLPVANVARLLWLLRGALWSHATTEIEGE
ncbi:MAG: hypothetical protein HN849_12780 [Victivallales bacterium]|jgi:hypothetical protein|nr:hypothetical protein [Victivallales bacterium]MBT7164321.1 hypothetical protein [Victivallales bacterium]MBT7300387.1 hypothetical protein [Victivallales bacterium]